MRISSIMMALAAMAAGGLAALGFAPLDLWWLTVIGLALLVGLIDRAGSWRQALLLGWLWGVGHFALGLNWIAKAFTYQAKMPAVLGWVAVIGLALYLAVFIALPALAARLAPSGPARVAALAGGLVIGERLRGTLLSGFPWDPLGAAWLGAGDMAQLAGLVGSHGLTALIALAGGALWLLAMGPGATGRGVGAALAVMLGTAGVLAPMLNGETYFPDAPTVFAVQSNIGEEVRYADDDANIETYLALTRAALADRAGANPMGAVAGAEPGPDSLDGAPVAPTVPSNPNVPTTPGRIPDADAAPAASIGAGGVQQRGAIIVWPEGAVLPPVEADPGLRARLAAILGPQDLLLFGGTGVVTSNGRVTAYANSLFALDARGRLVARYDKAHLVPLGEYVPARPLMSAIGLSRLVPGDFDFQPGPGPRSLTVPGFTPFGALICYEVIFPGAVVQAGARPAWLVNVSNDAWYGAWGPPQHLAQARLRAIEEGLPMVRATPTGVSAVIDAHGNVVAREAQGRRGVIAATLPPPLPPPFVARQDHWPPLWLAALLIAAAALPAFRKRI